MEHVVVVGAGQAGAALVAKLRDLGYTGRITLIGDEASAPYQRPPLSKAYLLGKLDRERLLLRPEAFWTDRRVDLRVSTRVTAIRPAERVVEIGDERLGYDALVLATGARPLALPAAIGGDLRNVFTLRTLADVDRFEPEFRPGRRLLVVGGGYIGLEAAAVAAASGLHVTVLERAERILQRVASPQTAGHFRALHARHGVEILEGAALDRLEGDDAGTVRRARLADGRVLDVDLVVVGIGVAPATDLAAAAGLAIDNGIAVDALGRTSAPDVWACGDCASFPHDGRRIRLESVPNAIDHADTVAANLLGAEKPYVPKPWFWSDQFETKLQIAGLGTGYDRVVARPGGKEGAVSFWYYAGDRLLAVDAVDDARAFMAARRMIEAGHSPDPAAVADPAVDLKTLLPAGRP
ncbi:NAD(P)/FAD-dependent oxidoreductase [Oharaeibacter diazotrophicus]|uniref:3-phenylpropionate/trans-cinnamate dioxygenase ferredoxin reductase subunit n=1 Tax=Oharaeibacter diazotrophicus TaxID=1920512 RepID=A0A4V6PVC6_9HYPH|nr:FAD-dependent oxidoreductase [Oharaeibacter diazotrophicus]TDP81138.1 3-phenylpropionate/trans-cinnamate dioxygenase ferredoxin reductase subunit [Oharaeibacter diazotrophicus]BBE74869.1 pyridine nucleotide-disulfide oxidoreductase [Pleomorphomonas sp. SM30]GLS75627.1 pyridine nucleotide-disulfide oxidoreductase [Oharaeibacter diazotrophicus]